MKKEAKKVKEIIAEKPEPKVEKKTKKVEQEVKEVEKKGFFKRLFGK